MLELLLVILIKLKLIASALVLSTMIFLVGLMVTGHIHLCEIEKYSFVNTENKIT